MPKKIRLLPELVPRPLWGISAYRLLDRPVWKAIRKNAIEAARNRCSICGNAKGLLTCHEKWSYDDERLTATLVGLEIHCDPCDAVTHAGRSIVHGSADVILEQLCKVNGCTPAEAKRIVTAAYMQWKERSRKEWTVAVAAPLLKKYPQLEIVSGRRKSDKSVTGGV